MHTFYTNQDHQSFGWSVKETTNRNCEFGDTDLMNSMDLSMIFRPLYHKEALLAPSGALVVIMVYYKPLFQIFQILQIRK